MRDGTIDSWANPTVYKPTNEYKERLKQVRTATEIQNAYNNIANYLTEIERVEQQLENLSYTNYNEQLDEQQQYIDYLYNEIARKTNFIVFGKEELN